MHSWMRKVARAMLLFHVSLFMLSVTAFTVHHVSEASTKTNAGTQKFTSSFSPDPDCDVFYMMVSTIDGKISVLDLHQRGQVAWSIDADSQPLVSSSLANLEMVRNGRKMRLIPALDGAIYQFDGEKVEPIPMSAESLLSSSYQLSDDAMIVGSKSVQNFGINFKTGEIQFICNSDGCNNDQRETKDPMNGSDVVVVTRVTQTVRSVDIKQGNEKWNFSVGEHLLNLPAVDAPSQIEDHYEKLDDDLPRILSGENEKKCPSPDDDGEENFLRLVVPEGKVVALNRHDASRVAWEHKFTSPIAKAWLFRKGRLHVMNLFTEQHIPSMSTFTPDDIETDSATQPLLYIGSHHKILYIQPSPGMEAVLKMYSGRRIGHVFDPSIKVSWRPYLNTASARTPIFGGNRQHGMESKSLGKSHERQKKSLAVWHEEYPFDTGYFLYPEFRDPRSIKKPMLIEDLKGDISFINLFWSYKKEIILVIIVTVVITNFVDLIVERVFFKRRNSKSSNQSDSANNSKNTENDSGISLISSPNSLSPLNNVSNQGEYVSRFATDFDCVQCLGKGGFGVVMEVVNRVDEQHYAVKRIPLPRSKGAKDKVLREVKALAKLEHVGIVRYFNAWVESPPPGWQEEKDVDWGLSDISGQTITHVTPSTAAPSITNRGRKSVRRKSPRSYNQGEDRFDNSTNGLDSQLDLDLNTNTDSVVFVSEESVKDLPRHRRAGSGSGEFSVHSNLSDSRTSSYDTEVSLLRGNMRNRLRQSFSLDDDTKSQSHSRSSVPFSNYSKTSSINASGLDDEMSGDSVVFEQSKSHIKPLGDINDASEVTDLRVSSLTNDEDKNEEMEPNYEKPAKEQGVKCFLYIQMQLYQKETLKEWLHNNTLNRNQADLMDIFDQLLCAVDYVHTCGLMHRDLKPSNIFFSSEGVVKVGDFGLVTPLSVQEDTEECEELFHSSGSTYTADVGTTLYMSPEQIARKPYNLKVDVFSLGLIFLELWMPFSTQMERIRTLQDAKNHILPDRFERELPVECELVKRMTSQDPSLRPDIKEVMNHSLLKDYAPTRIPQRARSRTISNDSKD